MSFLVFALTVSWYIASKLLLISAPTCSDNLDFYLLWSFSQIVNYLMILGVQFMASLKCLIDKPLHSYLSAPKRYIFFKNCEVI